ncbi:hypothetical protein EC988_009432, partial [Linderina pennispora]
DGETLFMIKWEGYDDPADNTWETEDNIIDKDILKKYWDDYNAKAAKKAAPAKKRGRPASNGASSLKAKEAATKRRRTSARQEATAKQNPRQKPRQETEPEAAEAESNEASDQEIVYGEEGPEVDDWVPLLDEIITLDATDDGLIAQIQWKNGQKCEYPIELIYAKLPMQMLKFYEQRLRFRSSQ